MSVLVAVEKVKIATDMFGLGQLASDTVHVGNALRWVAMTQNLGVELTQAFRLFFSKLVPGE